MGVAVAVVPRFAPFVRWRLLGAAGCSALLLLRRCCAKRLCRADELRLSLQFFACDSHYHCRCH
eukprot:5859370-Pleurochrysis_carterae.AAC.1